MNSQSETKKGAINAVCAYFLWGIAPIYFKLLADVSAPEILIHRIVWSFALLFVVVIAMGNWRKVQQIINHPKTLLWLLATSIILAANWLIFIWAVNNNHILEASLGYFINPLFNVVLGMIFFAERLRKWQVIAVLLALVGVLIQVISLGTIPYIGLSLAATFGIYGLMRKKVPVESVPGLLIESAWMLPIGLAYWYFFLDSTTSNMLSNQTSLNLTLIAAGLVTTAPLLFFTGAAKRLALSTLGFFQYIGPSIMFIVAILLYGETLAFEKMLTFACIWTALIVFSLDSFRQFKNKKGS
ncbi:EamA family transporter RarD [Thalassomonas sp. M1454]|uniref:EamA family transporter RarD n=1 Tax=Thalassomonas sp. M1454 TaxID=2594477 RepID=UPI00117F5C3B|nr:EamA family transporter RarD [Thalassomonas sp. M1454]TRX55189.1 EamA family transporter RarD [Thalassomonas sp. M1454]